MNNTSAHEGKRDFLILKNWFPSTTANKVHVWTLCGSPRIKSSSYQLLNAVIFNVLVRHFCPGILGVENPSLKPKWGGWPARSCALITGWHRVTFLQRGAAAGTELEIEPRSPALRGWSGEILFSGGFCWAAVLMAAAVAWIMDHEMGKIGGFWNKNYNSGVISWFWSCLHPLTAHCGMAPALLSLGGSI